MKIVESFDKEKERKNKIKETRSSSNVIYNIIPNNKGINNVENEKRRNERNQRKKK